MIWKKVLQNEIQKLDGSEPQCSFISSKPLYESHISKLSDAIHYTIIHPTT